MLPHGPTLVDKVVPVGRVKGLRGYCKYCYRTHRQWWLMPSPSAQLRACDPDKFEKYSDEELNDRYGDIDPDGKPTRALLCGYCEHSSLECFI